MLRKHLYSLLIQTLFVWMILKRMMNALSITPRRLVVITLLLALMVGGGIGAYVYAPGWFGEKELASDEPDPELARQLLVHADPDLPFEDLRDGAIPEILSDEDRELYRQVFALQKEGNWMEADRLIGKIEDGILSGHVLAERYLHSGYYSRYRELTLWMQQYADQPQAGRIYKLALKKQPQKGAVPLEEPDETYLGGYGGSNGLSGSLFNSYAHLLNWQGRERAQQLWDRCRNYVERGWITKAAELIEAAKAKDLLKPMERDLLRWNVAAAYYAYGYDQKAYDAAKPVALRSGKKFPEVYWLTGISAWRLKDYTAASGFFAKGAEAENQSPWDRAGSAFWAFRAFSELGEHGKAGKYLEIAAEYPRTFYGIIARKQMDRSLDLDMEPAPLDDEVFEALLGEKAVRRMIALVEAGQQDLAEDELRALFPKLPPAESETLMSLAMALDLPAVQIRMAQRMAARATGRTYDYAAYPTPQWEPKDGFSVDPALVFAFIRQESGFHATARSYRGARGVMQVMPLTAKDMEKRAKLPHQGEDALYDPAYNITLGQRYLQYLMTRRDVNDNLFFLVAAYNAGPGNFAKWRSQIAYQDDPLLFIETIPSRETRNYIEQLLANYWIYREMLGQDTPSLNALLLGSWPQYDDGVTAVASLSPDLNLFDF